MTGAAEFEVSVEVLPGVRVLHVRGELDLATTPEFEEAVADDPGSMDRLVVDLTECTFLDSSAIRALLVAARAREHAGASATIVAPQPATLRVLEIAGVSEALPVVSTLAEAL